MALAEGSALDRSEFVEITPELERVVDEAAKVAVRFEEIAGKKLGISGEIGEVRVAKLLGLRLTRSSRTKGHDAVDHDGSKVEIKVRRAEVRDMPTATGRTSRFSMHPFDYALLAILSRSYDVFEVYRADFDKLSMEIRRSPKRTVAIGTFKRIGWRVYPR